MEKIKILLGKIKFVRSLKLRIFVIMLLVGVVPGAVIEHSILDTYETRARGGA